MSVTRDVMKGRHAQLTDLPEVEVNGLQSVEDLTSLQELISSIARLGRQMFLEPSNSNGNDFIS